MNPPPWGSSPTQPPWSLSRALSKPACPGPTARPTWTLHFLLDCLLSSLGAEGQWGGGGLALSNPQKPDARILPHEMRLQRARSQRASQVLHISGRSQGAVRGAVRGVSRGCVQECPQALSGGLSPCCTRSVPWWEGRRGSARSRAWPGGPVLALNLAFSPERGRNPSAGPRGGQLTADLPLGDVCQVGSTPEILTSPHFLRVPGSPTASWLLWTSESQQPLSEDKCLSRKK